MNAQEPVALTVRFEQDGDDPITALHWEPTRGPAWAARRLPLSEQIGHFQSNDLTLRAKLVLPEGAGPHPLVVIVHGSERLAAVDAYYEPYLFAAQGVGALVYDKRGTGGSEGRFTMDFALLAGDAAAAVTFARTQPGVDPARVELVGFSQGGWVAPLAALEAKPAFVVVGFGMAEGPA